MTVHMTPGYANAVIRNNIIVQIRLLDRLIAVSGTPVRLLEDGSYAPVTFGVVTFDSHLVAIYTETCVKQSGSEWVHDGKWGPLPKGHGNIWQEGEILCSAVKEYYKRAGIKKYTKPVIVN